MGIHRIAAASSHEEKEFVTGSLILIVLLAYLLGSFPTAYLVGTVNGIDLRTVGSGNLGATNVMRTLGWKWGLIVYVVDFAKGVVPVTVFPLLSSEAPVWLPMVAGTVAILGHVKPVFLLGRGGGKGVATASGVFVGLAPIPAVAAIAAFAVVVTLTRYVSLGSIIGAVVLAVVLHWTTPGAPLAWLGTSIATFVIVTHRDNIRRLLRGEERRIGGSASAGGGAS